VDLWTQGALERIGGALFKGGFGTNVSAIFSRIDANNDGKLSAEEFTRALRDLRLDFTDAEIKRIIEAVDLNKSACRHRRCTASPPRVHLSPPPPPPPPPAPPPAGGDINYTEFVQVGPRAHDHAPPTAHTTLGMRRSIPPPSLPPLDDPQAFKVTDMASLAPSSVMAGTAAAGGAGAVPGTPGGSLSARSWQKGVIERVVATLFEYRCVAMCSAVLCARA